VYVCVCVCVCVFVRACAQVNADSAAAETLESLRKTKKDEALFIMGFELLDNMPHDKVFCFFHFILILQSFRLAACVGRLQSLLQFNQPRVFRQICNGSLCSEHEAVHK